MKKQMTLVYESEFTGKKSVDRLEILEIEKYHFVTNWVENHIYIGKKVTTPRKCVDGTLTGEISEINFDDNVAKIKFEEGEVEINFVHLFFWLSNEWNLSVYEISQRFSNFPIFHHTFMKQNNKKLDILLIVDESSTQSENIERKIQDLKTGIEQEFLGYELNVEYQKDSEFNKNDVPEGFLLFPSNLMI